MVREVNENDLDQLLDLYLHLHETEIPPKDDHLKSTWQHILNDPNYHLIVKEVDGLLVSSCVCVIIPNLTRGVRSYAFVENVVTREGYRKKGYASECLDYAKKIAESNDCYKMMLITGSKNLATLNFYKNAGYVDDRTAFYQSI